MAKTEEEIIKETFFCKWNTLVNACQKLKESVFKVYGKPFIIVCDFINSILYQKRGKS